LWMRVRNCSRFTRGRESYEIEMLHDVIGNLSIRFLVNNVFAQYKTHEAAMSIFGQIENLGGILDVHFRVKNDAGF